MGKIIIILTIFLYALSLHGQSLKLDTSFTATYLIDKVLLGNGIRVGNIKMTGLKQSICYFSGDTNMLGMSKGILLSTGNVADIARPNTSPGTSGTSWDYSKNNKYKGDKDLNALGGDMTYDNVIIEFDFVPYNNSVSFNFLFASEEYPEYVGSEFNDVFAFILTGSNIRKQNLAVVPDTDEPITINNINQKKNKELFINNNYFHNYTIKKNNERNSAFTDLRHSIAKIFYQKTSDKGIYYSLAEKKKLNKYLVSNFEFDGLTKVLTASCILQPWKLYHLKIAIGDVADAIFDSGVMLEAGSFNSKNDTSVANYKTYPDLSGQLNWDSVFGKKKIKPVVFPPIEEQFKITNINFETDRAEVPDTSKRKLDLLAGYLSKHVNYKLSIMGHTDNVGGEKYNLQLSEKRAIAIMDYLISKGIEKVRLEFAGNSFYNPVADNLKEKGRLLNRRVALTIFDSNNKNPIQKNE